MGRVGGGGVGGEEGGGRSLLRVKCKVRGRPGEIQRFCSDLVSDPISDTYQLFDF